MVNTQRSGILLNIKPLFRQLLLLTYFMMLNNVLAEPPKRIVMGTQNQTFQIQSDCEQFEILTNYKHIALTIKNAKNLDIVMITDKVLQDCNLKNCQEDSNICQSKYIIKKT